MSAFKFEAAALAAVLVLSGLACQKHQQLVEQQVAQAETQPPAAGFTAAKPPHPAGRRAAESATAPGRGTVQRDHAACRVAAATKGSARRSSDSALPGLAP